MAGYEKSDTTRSLSHVGAIVVPGGNRTGRTYGIVKKPICRRQLEVYTRLPFSQQRQNISHRGNSHAKASKSRRKNNHTRRSQTARKKANEKGPVGGEDFRCQSIWTEGYCCISNVGALVTSA